jgi:rhodanese-related sulfurtransferase
VSSVRVFSTGAPQHDDVTVLVVCYHGRQEARAQ